MRIDSVKIINYRQYQDAFFQFDQPNQGNADLHIIIGRNGVGKTNLLNAINWCLYNDEPHIGSLTYRNDKKSICNAKSILETKGIGDEFVAVKVVIIARSTIENIKLTIERSLKYSVRTEMTGADEFIVTQTNLLTNQSDVKTNAEATEIIRSKFPQAIRGYFFFDGEQLSDYFDSQQQKNVRSSIYKMSKITDLENLENDLRGVISSYCKQISKDIPKCQEIETELNNCKQSKDEYERKINTLNQDRAISNREFERLTRQISGMECIADEQKQLDLTQSQIDDFNKTLNTNKSKLYKLTRDLFISIILYKTNQSVYHYIIDASTKGQLPPRIDISVLNDTLKDEQCKICGSHLSETAIQKIQNLLDQINFSSSVSHKLVEIKSDLEKWCSRPRDLNDQINSLIKEQAHIEQKIRECELTKEELINKIKLCPDPDEITNCIERRNFYRNQIAKDSEEIGQLTPKLNKCQEKIKEYQTKLIEATQKQESNKIVNNYYLFATNALDLLEKLKTKCISDLRIQIETETMRIFEKLEWKKNTFDRITLDEDYNMAVYNKHLNNTDLVGSSAERQLLALAFTLAMHRISGFDSLLFIDTPVGRVDTENRSNFAKSLVEISKTKQIILALTPSEFSKEIQAQFTNTIVASKHILKPIDEIYTNAIKEI